MLRCPLSWMSEGSHRWSAGCELDVDLGGCACASALRSFGEPCVWWTRSAFLTPLRCSPLLDGLFYIDLFLACNSWNPELRETLSTCARAARGHISLECWIRPCSGALKPRRICFL